MRALLLITLLIIVSCGELTPKDKVQNVKLTNGLEVDQSKFTQDFSGEIFETHPWYAYDQNNHIIWPLFNVYALKKFNNTTKQYDYIKFQILNYYSTSEDPGIYTIRFQFNEEADKEFTFEAKGCGNVYTNADFNNCQKDPEKNVYSYIDLDTLKVSKKTDREARRAKDWHIAFNGTSIKLNSGKSGKGTVRGGLLFSNSSFSKGEDADFNAIAIEAFSSAGKNYFDKNYDLINTKYYLPKGIERAIHESDWYKKSRKEIVAKPENFWLLKTGVAKSYAKINISNIETIDKVSSLTLSYELENVIKEIRIENLNHSTLSYEICLNLELEAIVECSKAHDLTFMALHRRNRIKWQLRTTHGALGPMSRSDIDSLDFSTLE